MSIPKYFSRFTLILYSVLIITVRAEVETSPDSSNTNTLPELDRIVVVDNRTESLLNNPGKEALSLDLSTTHINEEMMSSQNARTVTDALKFAPGSWTETRGRKVKQMVSFRG